MHTCICMAAVHQIIIIIIIHVSRRDQVPARYVQVQPTGSKQAYQRQSCTTSMQLSTHLGHCTVTLVTCTVTLAVTMTTTLVTSRAAHSALTAPGVSVCACSYIPGVVRPKQSPASLVQTVVSWVASVPNCCSTKVGSPTAWWHCNNQNM